jgi:hypothetical protein
MLVADSSSCYSYFLEHCNANMQHQGKLTNYWYNFSHKYDHEIYFNGHIWDVAMGANCFTKKETLDYNIVHLY